MTRPRALQINNPQVAYTKQLNLASVSSSSKSVDRAVLESVSTTNAVGGTLQSLPAEMTGTAGPFTGVTTGNSFGIRMPGVLGGNVVTVAFIGSDFLTVGADTSVLTAARVAAAIRRELGAAVGIGDDAEAACDVRGCVRVFSRKHTMAGWEFDYGDDAYVTLTESGHTPGILAKLGFGAVAFKSSWGATAPVRGLHTSSLDVVTGAGSFGPSGSCAYEGKAGYCQLRYVNGEAVLTAPTHNVCFPGAGSLPNAVGGQAVYAYLSYPYYLNANECRFSFFAHGYRNAAIVGENGDFASLVTGDTLEIEMGVDGLVSIVQVPFATGTVLSVDGAVNAVNSTYWAAGFGTAVVIASVPEPYELDDTDFLHMRRDGVQCMCSFANAVGKTSAQDIADEINSGTFAGFASVVNAGGKNYLQLSSDLPAGPNSSVQVLSLTTKATLAKLGLQVGIVAGSNICSKVGTEIQFQLPFCDPVPAKMAQFYIVLRNASGDACNKLGIRPAQVNVPEYASMGEFVAVPPPWPEAGASAASVYVMLPEVVEYGDIEPDFASTAAKFQNIDTVPQLDTSTRGIEQSGKPATLDRQGLVPSHLLSSALPALSLDTLTVGAKTPAMTPRLSMPYSRSTGTLSVTLLTESIGVPATAPPATVKNTYAERNYAFSYIFGGGNTASHVSTWNARWLPSTGKWTKDLADKSASMIAFDNNGYWQLGVQSAGDNADWEEFTRMVLIRTDNPESGPTIELLSGGFYANADTLLFSDNNMVGIGSDYMKLTQADAGAQFLRLSDVFQAPSASSIVRHLNSRTHITVGDGVNTFGDFNGTNGLIDAVAFLTSTPAIGTRRATIHLKSGSYTGGIAIATNTGIIDLEIVGMPGGDNVTAAGTYGTCIIEQPLSDMNTVTFTRTGTSIGSLTLKNVAVHVRGLYYGVEMVGGAHLHMDRCRVQCVSVNNPAAQSDGGQVKRAAVSISNCRLSGSPDAGGNGPLTFKNVAAAPETFVVENSTFAYGLAEQRCVYIHASAGISSVVRMGALQFKNCKFNLSPGKLDNGNLTANTGLIDLNPNGKNVRAGAGLIVDSILFEDCDVDAVYTGSGWSNILLHLLPTANGTVASGASEFAYVDNLSFNRTRFNWVPNAGATVSPFTVAFREYGRVSFNGCIFNRNSLVFPASCKQGYCTVDVDYAFTTIADNEWGAVSMSCNEIVIRDCEFDRFVLGGETGDLNLQWYRNLVATGLVFSNYDLTNESLQPLKRIRLNCPVITGTGSFSASLLGSLTTLSTVGSWGGNFITVHGYNLTIHDTTIRNFVCTIPTTPATNGIATVDGDSYGVSVVQCTIDGVKSPVKIIDTAGKTTLSRCTFTRCVDDVDINTAYDIEVSNCTVTDFIGNFGLRITYRNETQSILVCNNTVKGNGGIGCNAGLTKFAQIWFGSSAGGKVYPNIVATGNNCGGYGITPNNCIIRILNRNTGYEAVGPGKHLTSNNLVGLETSYDTTGPGTAILIFDDDGECLHNIARLRNKLDGEA
jgi:hypothetical protein